MNPAVAASRSTLLSSSSSRTNNFSDVRTQFGSLLFGQRVVDEHPRARFASRQIFKFGRSPQRRIELYVKMVVVIVFRISRALVNDHHVRKRDIEELVISHEQSLHERGQVLLFRLIEIRQRLYVSLGRDVNFIRPARKEWNVSGK